jgi:hypothetical protein
MATLITFDNNGKSKKWFINPYKLKQIGILNNLEGDINFMNEFIKIKNINNDDFSIVYNLLQGNNNINSYDINTLFNIYKITDYLIIKDLQEIIGEKIAYKLNKMNFEELKNNIYNLFYDNEKNINLN